MHFGGMGVIFLTEQRHSIFLNHYISLKLLFGAFLIYSDKKGRHMRIRYLQKEGYGLSRWSGGVTSEIYIYPENGNYSQRDFKMRVSSAEVELEESVFTPLEGIDRWITPLEGSFELSHDGGPFLKMGPLDPPHFFSGGSRTLCRGKARDINLMLKGAGGEMRIVSSKVKVSGICLVYALSDMTVVTEGADILVRAGDSLLFEGSGEIGLTEKSILCHMEI